MTTLLGAVFTERGACQCRNDTLVREIRPPMSLLQRTAPRTVPAGHIPLVAAAVEFRHARHRRFWADRTFARGPGTNRPSAQWTIDHCPMPSS